MVGYLFHPIEILLYYSKVLGGLVFQEEIATMERRKIEEDLVQEE